jgi:pyruvate/2-oxoglutarate/acetoin dehydrogenase E1 component
MQLLANEGAIFLGQNVAYDGSAMYHDFDNVPMNKRIELPVCEELQMGMCTGLALQGFLPVSIYPRLDFLLLAINQLINHLDKIKLMSNGQFNPKIIIRTKIGKTKPLNAGPQHTQDHTKALTLMCTNIVVEKITRISQVLPTYKSAIKRPQSTLVIEAI